MLCAVRGSLCDWLQLGVSEHMGEKPGRGSPPPGSTILTPLHHRPDLTASCAELLNQTWRRSLGARIHSLEKSLDDFPVCLVLIGAPEGPVLGHARLSKVIGLPDSLFVESVVVSADLRGKGYGRRLMEATERYARGKGFRNLYLTTHDKQDFYYHLGYRLTEPVQNMGRLGSLVSQKMTPSKTNPTFNHHGGPSSLPNKPPCPAPQECSGVEPPRTPSESLEHFSRAIPIPPSPLCPTSTSLLPLCPTSTLLSPPPPPPPPPCPTSIPLPPHPRCPTSTPLSPSPPPPPPPCPTSALLSPPPPPPCPTSIPLSPPHPRCPTSSPLSPSPPPPPPPCPTSALISPPPPPPPPLCPTSTGLPPPPSPPCPTSTPLSHPPPPPLPSPTSTPLPPPPPLYPTSNPLSSPPMPPCPISTPLAPPPPPPAPPFPTSTPFLSPPPPSASLLPCSSFSSFPQSLSPAKTGSTLQTPYRDFRGDPIFWMMKSL
ncbi:N-alpha-acetyltransferase 80 [Lithobates pipiens]